MPRSEEEVAVQGVEPLVGNEGERRPAPIDLHIGSRIRLRRTMLNMSMERLAESLVVTYQQVQKYERGVNRVGAARLFDISRALDVPIGFFFDDLSATSRADIKGPALRWKDRETDSPDPVAEVLANRREAVELVGAFYRIASPSHRRLVFDLIKSMGSPDPASDL
jgi:transcriptional regulator with XRE-family HTH domain